MLQSFDGHKAVHYQELDPGNEWVKDSDIAINSNGPLDSGGVYTPNVIKVPSGGYRMYYFGVSTAGSKAKPVGSFSVPTLTMLTTGTKRLEYVWILIINCRVALRCLRM